MPKEEVTPKLVTVTITPITQSEALEQQGSESKKRPVFSEKRDLSFLKKETCLFWINPTAWRFVTS